MESDKEKALAKEKEKALAIAKEKEKAFAEEKENALAKEKSFAKEKQKSLTRQKQEARSLQTIVLKDISVKGDIYLQHRCVVKYFSTSKPCILKGVTLHCTSYNYLRPRSKSQSRVKQKNPDKSKVK